MMGRRSPPVDETVYVYGFPRLLSYFWLEMSVAPSSASASTNDLSRVIEYLQGYMTHDLPNLPPCPSFSSMLDMCIHAYHKKTQASEIEQYIEPALARLSGIKGREEHHVYMIRLTDYMKDLLQHHTFSRSTSDLLLYARLRAYAACFPHRPSALLVDEEDIPKEEVERLEKKDALDSEYLEREHQESCCEKAFYNTYYGTFDAFRKEDRGYTRAMQYIQMSKRCEHAIAHITSTDYEAYADECEAKGYYGDRQSYIFTKIEEDIHDMGMSSSMLYTCGREVEDLEFASTYYRKMAYTQFFQIKHTRFEGSDYPYDYVPTRIPFVYQENACPWIDSFVIEDTYLMDPYAQLEQEVLVSLEEMPSFMFKRSAKRLRDAHTNGRFD